MSPAHHASPTSRPVLDDVPYPPARHQAQRVGGLAADLGIALETERLAALLDGLTLGGALHLVQVAPDTARAILW